MLFNSIPFIILLLVSFVLYYQNFLRKHQVSLLIISSLIFYSYNNIYLVTLLLTSIVINSYTSYQVAFGSKNHRKFNAVLGVTLNLFILGFFKYSPLIGTTFFDTQNGIGEFLISIPLPIGISFYTFQGLSLLVDVFRENESQKSIADKNFITHFKNTTFFIAFFPQLVAGPIVKAHDFYKQIEVKYFRNIDWEFAFRKIILGYFLKLVIADNLKDFTCWIENPHFLRFDSISLMVFLFGYSMQIFADFAGYSLIAIGLAQLFGYKLMENFNFPYIAKSFKEFWKRWHISLSSFLMEYLYFPLGGNKKGRFRTYLNLLITMILGGLWHGAAWSYAIWGLFHGLLLAIERFISHYIKLPKYRIINVFKMILVFTAISIGWLLFKLPNFEHVILFIKTLYHNIGFKIDIEKCTYVEVYSIPVILYHLFYVFRDKTWMIKIRKLDYVFYGLMIFLIITNSGMSDAFIYFQF